MLSHIRHLAAVAAFTALVSIAAALPSQSHEGHDHGAPPPPVSRTIAPRADAASSDFEIVAVARGGRLLIYLDTFRENEPVSGAQIEIDGPAGILKLVADGPGVYSAAAPFLGKPGRYDLALTVMAGDTVDVLTATLKIPENAIAAAGGTSAIIAPGSGQDAKAGIAKADLSMLVAAAAGFLAGAVVVLFSTGRRRNGAAALLIVLASAAMAGDARAAEPPVIAARDLAQRFPDGSVFVPKATQRILGLRTLFTGIEPHFMAVELPGRVIPDPNASGLVQSSVGGRLSPPEGGFKPLGTPVKAGDILAFVRPPVAAADATSQQQQARELDQQISIIARKVERLRSIQQVIAQSQLEDAELELKGLKERRANLDRAKRDAEPLTAPVDGVIAASNAVAGQMAEPNSVIFQIVDPAKLWVEALSFEPQTMTATASVRLTDGRTLELAYIGTGLAGGNQSVPVHFAIRGDTKPLRAGQFLTVLARTAGEHRGIALPRASVLRGANGQSIVYEHTNAERFVPREVRVEPLDGERVLAVSGIEPGKRVVTQGAELLNQIR